MISGRRSKAPSPARKVSHARGMTLVETLISMLIFVLSCVWLTAAYHSVLELNRVSEQTMVALNDLQDMMERVRSSPFTQLAVSFPNGVAGGYAPIVGGYTLPNEQIIVTHLPDTVADPRELIVEVNWFDSNRLYRRRLSTVRTSELS